MTLCLLGPEIPWERRDGGILLGNPQDIQCQGPPCPWVRAPSTGLVAGELWEKVLGEALFFSAHK